MKNPFDQSPDPLPVQEEPSYRGRGERLYLGDTGRIWFRILLTSFCKNDAQTPLPEGGAPKKGRSPLYLEEVVVW